MNECHSRKEYVRTNHVVNTDKRLTEGGGEGLCGIRAHTKAASNSYKQLISEERLLQIKGNTQIPGPRVNATPSMS